MTDRKNDIKHWQCKFYNDQCDLLNGLMEPNDEETFMINN